MGLPARRLGHRGQGRSFRAREHFGEQLQFGQLDRCRRGRGGALGCCSFASHPTRCSRGLLPGGFCLFGFGHDCLRQAAGLPESLADFVETVCVRAHQHVTKPPGGQNITEWCKKEASWERFRDTEFAVQAGVEAALLTRADGGARAGKHTIEDETTSEESELIDRVAQVPADTWFSLAAWAKDTQSLQPWQRGLSFSLGRLAGQGKRPSRKQAMHGENILGEARGLGFRG